MFIRLPEVGAVLALVLTLVIAKHVPLLAGLPLAQATGIICFSFAIYLALRLFSFELAQLRAED